MFRPLMFAMSLLYALPAPAERVPLDECRQLAEKLRSELPMKISSQSTLESVECVSGKAKPRLVYRNRVLTDIKKPSREVIERVKAEQRKAWCSDAAQRRFLQMVDISYAYYDASNRYLGALTHRIADCGK